MEKLELIKTIGNIIIEIDMLRSESTDEPDIRDRLDELRDELNSYQRSISRNFINENTTEFTNLTETLGEINSELRQSINEVNSVAEMLDTIVDFVGIVQKIVELIP